jgi:hypothetical protein
VTISVSYGFSTSPTWIARTIEFFTPPERRRDRRVDHAFLLIEGPPEPFSNMILEAAWCGWRISTVERLQASGARTVATVQAERLGGLPWAMSALDTHYAYLGVVGMIWVWLGRQFGRRWRNPFQRGVHAMFCSEAAVIFGHKSGERALRGLDAGSTSPQALLGVFPKERIKWMAESRP